MPQIADPGARRGPPVSYARQTLGHPNPIARFAHRRRHRFGIALAARHIGPGGAILDFGAGTGAFLRDLGHHRPDLHLLGHEPFMTLASGGIDRVPDLDTLADASLDAVSALEVCEHLTPTQIDAFLRQARRLLRPDGSLILSVPVMEGLALPVKEAARALLFRRASDHNAGDLIRGSLGRPVARAADILTSHKGFSHRLLAQRIEREFRPVETLFSPIPALPWWMNSQRFGVFVPRPA